MTSQAGKPGEPGKPGTGQTGGAGGVGGAGGAGEETGGIGGTGGVGGAASNRGRGPINRIWSVVAFVMAFVLVAAGYLRVENLANETNNALCDLRHDVELRLVNAEEFLRDNPEGAPGISRAVIRQSIANQQDTTKALSDLEC